MSSIEWTDVTWNPTTGCTKISPGCKFCYADVMAKRLRAMGQPKYANGFELTCHDDTLDMPLRWKKPRTIFVNSMSDLYHSDVPDEFIKKVFATMVQAHWHRFQVLTKRAERLLEMVPSLPWPTNVWQGVSVENADYTYRIDLLRQVPAAVRFLSVEPLLGPIPTMNLDGIDWVIVGGESGTKARPMDPDWARGIRDQCVASNVPFFFKPWGGRNKKAAGRMLDGRIWDELPNLDAAQPRIMLLKK